jgi:hypothetical protein
MTWGATITTTRSETAAPKPGHGQRIGMDTCHRRSPNGKPPGHLARAAVSAMAASGTVAAIINPDVARAVHLHRHRAAFYATSECERPPNHLRGGV